VQKSLAGVFSIPCGFLSRPLELNFFRGLKL